LAAAIDSCRAIYTTIRPIFTCYLRALVILE
jgi:hypothetical protein